MKITIIKCDHCGAELTESYKVNLKRVSGSDPGEEWIIADEKLLMKTRKAAQLDFCENCFENLVDLLLDKDHRLIADKPKRETLEEREKMEEFERRCNRKNFLEP